MNSLGMKQQKLPKITRQNKKNSRKPNNNIGLATTTHIMPMFGCDIEKATQRVVLRWSEKFEPSTKLYLKTLEGENCSISYRSNDTDYILKGNLNSVLSNVLRGPVDYFNNPDRKTMNNQELVSNIECDKGIEKIINSFN